MHSWITISFGDPRPLYLQVIEQVKRRVAVGDLLPGTELPSIRELAAFQINAPREDQLPKARGDRKPLYSDVVDLRGVQTGCSVELMRRCTSRRFTLVRPIASE